MTQNEQQPRFNPNEHLMQLKSKEGAKDYLPVQFRLVWFREQCPQGTIDTEEVEVDLDREVEEEAFVWSKEKNRSEKVIKRAKGYARYKAIVTDGKGGRSTGTKSENAASFPDYIEKAETGAIGRALAGLGYGTAFAPEFNEAHRIVDSPVSPYYSNDAANSTANSTNGAPTPRPAVNTALLDLLNKTVARSDALGMVWADTKTDAGFPGVPDKDLKPADLGKINGVLATYEKSIGVVAKA